MYTDTQTTHIYIHIHIHTVPVANLHGRTPAVMTSFLPSLVSSDISVHCIPGREVMGEGGGYGVVTMLLCLNGHTTFYGMNAVILF